MGQAKQRGTLEDRKQEGIAKNRERIATIEHNQRVREANMSPQERRKRHETRMMLSMCMGLSMGAMPLHPRKQTPEFPR
ncbi:hypothetical protein YA0089_26815 [Pseudomonas viridiflava]|uniref:hypothetical protein n=1 Tax=Pseudomonas viridiflava TaxID=33069 RepID=UPI0018E5BDA1|nr:hypothetical protein [Pseudomonas viridiflava]MBI6727231.1 hypothetical protein [Pseudomonas viridiflava]